MPWPAKPPRSIPAIALGAAAWVLCGPMIALGFLAMGYMVMAKGIWSAAALPAAGALGLLGYWAIYWRQVWTHRGLATVILACFVMGILLAVFLTCAYLTDPEYGPAAVFALFAAHAALRLRNVYSGLHVAGIDTKRLTYSAWPLAISVLGGLILLSAGLTN